MKVRRLELDFARHTPGLRVAGWAALGLSVATLAIVLLLYRHAATDIAAVENSIRALTGARQPPRTAASGRDAELLARQTKVAAVTAQRLSLPWAELIGDLERARHADIGLLSIEPDANNRQVRITGEARDPAVLLEYMSALEATKSIRDVHLTQHAWRRSQPVPSLWFSLTCAWEQSS